MGQHGRRADREERLNTHAGSFPGQGGIEIKWQSWSPEDPPRAIVLIAHGVSEHSDRYAHVAARLVRDGYDVYALDHRGHGDSGGRRCVIDRISNVVDDIDTLIELARSEHPGSRFFLLGHSMGGALALEYALEQQDRLDGLVLSAPAALLEAATPVELLLGRLLSAVVPTVGVFPVDPSAISRDPEVVRAYVEDPRVFHGKLPARTVAELAKAIQTFPTRAPQLALPLLVMLGTDDRLVPPAAGRMVHERAASPDKRLIEYDGLYHEILNEPEQDKVMDDLVAWLNAH